MTVKEIIEKLGENGYVATTDVAVAVKGAIDANRPLLVEGEPGVGKTTLAKATSLMTGYPLLRVQFYEGLTYDKILYDFDYQKQLLTIEAMRGALEQAMKKKSLEDAKKVTETVDFYSEEFLIKRPIAKAFDGSGPYVLLLDEVDKASEEIEYTLLEALDEWAITIPQFGRIECPPEKRPITFLTSNDYRELSGALRRRCGYLYVDRKTKEEMKAILLARATNDPTLAEAAASAIERIASLPMRQAPSVSEAIALAQRIEESGEPLSRRTLDEALFLIVKNKRDRDLAKRAIAAGEVI